MSAVVYVIEEAAGHFFPRHPECPQRVTAIKEALQRLRVFDECASGEAVQLSGLPLQLPEGLLLSVHTAEHVASLKATSAQVTRPTAVRDPDDPDGPTYATPSSYEDALRAACAAVALVDAVVAGDRRSGGRGGGQRQLAPAGFSICRPPGHHATAGDQMGFCLLNNAALVARHAQQRHGLRKVLILDWDVHHGNGTQDLFYEDPSVLLIDLHQMGAWPGSGGINETGAGPGQGATVNVPLPWHSGHTAAQGAFQQVVAPAARRFQPDLIIVSAGYDAHWQDPLEHLQFQAGTYHWLTSAVHQLAAELCGGRLLLLLEGGYNQQALGECVADTVLALLQKPSAHPLLDAAQLPHSEPAEQVDALIREVKQLHSL